MAFLAQHRTPGSPVSGTEEFPSEGAPMHPFVPTTPTSATPPPPSGVDVAAVQQRMSALHAEMQQVTRSLAQLRAEISTAATASAAGEKQKDIGGGSGGAQPTNVSIVFQSHHHDEARGEPTTTENDGPLWLVFLNRFATPFSVLRSSILLLLVCVSIYVTYSLVVDWIETGQYPSTAFSQVDASALGLPSAGMIPAPYATDANCFQPAPKRCVAFFGEATGGSRRQFDCLPWLTSVNVSSASRGGSMTIYLLDGVKAAASGYYFTSILDYVQYTFEFSPACSEPYLWVFVSGDTALANLDPSESMQTLAQSSFLIQGGQYVMVAFQLQQDVDLAGDVRNTTLLTASSMAVKDFNASLALEATAVFRPASFKVQTNTALPGQSFWEMVANLGGWVGLFLGFSLIQIIDAAELLHEWYKGREAERSDHASKQAKTCDESNNAVLHNCAVAGCCPQLHHHHTPLPGASSNGYLHHSYAGDAQGGHATAAVDGKAMKLKEDTNPSSASTEGGRLKRLVGGHGDAAFDASFQNLSDEKDH